MGVAPVKTVFVVILAKIIFAFIISFIVALLSSPNIITVALKSKKISVRKIL